MLELLGRELTKEVRKLIALGLNHEQQHQELLLTDIKYTFSCNPTFPVYYAGEILEERGETASNEFAELLAEFTKSVSRAAAFVLITNWRGTAFTAGFHDCENARDERRISRIRRRRRLRGFPSLARRRLGLGQSKSNKRAALLA
jgi:hypothetical protein